MKTAGLGLPQLLQRGQRVQAPVRVDEQMGSRVSLSETKTASRLTWRGTGVQVRIAGVH